MGGAKESGRSEKRLEEVHGEGDGLVVVEVWLLQEMKFGCCKR